MAPAVTAAPRAWAEPPPAARAPAAGHLRHTAPVDALRGIQTGNRRFGARRHARRSLQCDAWQPLPTNSSRSCSVRATACRCGAAARPFLALRGTSSFCLRCAWLSRAPAPRTGSRHWARGRWSHSAQGRLRAKPEARQPYRRGRDGSAGGRPARPADVLRQLAHAVSGCGSVPAQRPSRARPAAPAGDPMLQHRLAVQGDRFPS